MTTPDVSIILVSWNTRELLLRAIQCVYDTVRSASFEVIVVDNASADGSAEAVRERFPLARVIASPENVGFGRANNQGAEVAAGRHLLLLNTDAFVHEGAVDAMAAFLDARPEAGSVGCRLLYEDGSLQRSCSSFPTLATELWTALHLDKLLPASPIFGSYQMTNWDMDDTRPVDSLMGACLMVRGDAVKRVGLFDPQFFMYSEEVDLCYRLRRAGYQNYYLHDVSATHIWGGSSRQVAHESFLRLYRSRVQFFRKHYGLAATWAYKGVLLLSSVVRVASGPPLYALRRNADLLRISRNYMSLMRAVWAF